MLALIDVDAHFYVFVWYQDKLFDFIESKYRNYFHGITLSSALQNLLKIYFILDLHVSYFYNNVVFIFLENKRKLDLHLNNGTTKDDV